VIAESLIKMLMAGPEVSLRGSPTVSPTTAAIFKSFFSCHTFYAASNSSEASPSATLASICLTS
jgi:hypothetical protein